MVDYTKLVYLLYLLIMQNDGPRCPECGSILEASFETAIGLYECECGYHDVIEDSLEIDCYIQGDY